MKNPIEVQARVWEDVLRKKDGGVLSVPLEELRAHFARNQRQDVKIVVTKILDEALRAKLIQRNKLLKSEVVLEGPQWRHSASTDANAVIPANEFGLSDSDVAAKGPFGLAFANEDADQGEHYHRRHVEIYYSESAIRAEYRLKGETEVCTVDLKKGGVLVFGPLVVHKVKLFGMTMVVECPAVDDDRYDESIAMAGQLS